MPEGKVSSRELRRVLGSSTVQAVAELVHNDGVTRTKVTALEAKATEMEAFREMSLWDRLRWLFRGA